MNLDYDKLGSFGAGGLTGLTGGAFFIASALTFGKLTPIVNFLEALTTSTISIGPFIFTYGLIISGILVAIAGGVNTFRFGANSNENGYIGLGLLGLFLLMGLPQFSQWATTGGVSTILFLFTVAGYAVIGGIGSGNEENRGLVKSVASKPIDVITR